MKRTTKSAPPADGATILIVEDERIVAGDIEARLALLGYRVVATAATGDDAVRLAGDLRPRLVLMDIHLEGAMDGTEAAVVIRDQYDIPVVYLTAHADAPTLHRAKTTEPFGYLLKPFDDHELRTTIELALYKHRAEQRLKESEARFRSLAQTVSAAIFLLRDDKLSYVNHYLEDLAGYTAEELYAMRVFDLVHPEFRTMVEERARERATGAGDPGRYEFKIVRKDGAERWVDLAATRVTMDGVDTWLYTAIDITDRRLAEEERRALQGALAEAQKMESIGTLVAGLAHHFNNLLAIIQGYAQRIDRSVAENPRVTQSAHSIINAAQRGAALIQQLIGVTRKPNVEDTPVPLNILIKELAVLLREVLPPSITLVPQFTPPSPHIAGDYHQIHQALMNVCLNARDAMPEGGTLNISTVVISGGTLRARFPQAEAADYACIQIDDTGTGISEEVRSHVFEPFFTTKDRAVHTGMGLSMVYGIVASHRGFIDVRSAPGTGTTVLIYLPLVEVVTPLAAAPVERKADVILLVEDEEILRGLMQEVLMREGYEVRAEADGEAALERFTREHTCIDLVLLDLGLPKIAGDAVFTRIRAIDHDVPIILSTGFLRKENADETLRLNADGVIQKPFTLTELVTTVKSVLEKSEGGERSA
jgi:two-component system, cell cycle sensor histidine kinase and response regulator CckA